VRRQRERRIPEWKRRNNNNNKPKRNKKRAKGEESEISVWRMKLIKTRNGRRMTKTKRKGGKVGKGREGVKWVARKECKSNTLSQKQT